jgi:sulfoxide reductase heme-binding subunit YedZ
MIMSAHTRRTVLKLAVFIASLSPLALDVFAFVGHHLGRDPYRAVIRDTGVWSLWFLCFTLALTPLRRATAWHELVRFRRMLGLFAFFYGTVHTLAYVVFDRVAGLALPDGLVSWSAAAELTASTARDVWEKPFLAIGLAAFVAMVPLAATSTSEMIRRVGGQRWRQLHRLVYAVAVGSLIHHWWPLPDRLRVDIYGLLIGASFLFRIGWAYRGSMRIPAWR